MCGLVGMAGFINEADKNALKSLLILDVWRGEDSTGLAAVNKFNSDILLYKSIGHPESLFMKYKDFDDKGIYSGPASKVFIGHNRAATRGKIIDKNAHPFKHGNIVGAHNGTLITANTLENGNKFDVDSEAIFYNLSKYEPKSVINNIYGAYAITWYDHAMDKVYIIRNKERPLYWCRRLNDDVIFWASEEWMLTLALKKAKIPHTKIEEFKENTLYSLDVSDVTTEFRKVKFETEDNVMGYKPPPPPPQKKNTNTGGKTSNIIPFVGGKNSSNLSREELMSMRMLEGSTILFRYSTVKKGVSGSSYLSAYPNNPNLDYDIRIYGESHPNWNDWVKDLHVSYRGKIKKLVQTLIKNKWETYFLIDLRSITKEEIIMKGDTKKDKIPFDETSSEKEENDDADFYEGYMGKMLTHAEWLRATKNGCAGCGNPADDHDCDLVFIADDDFLCGVNGCCDDYKEYIPNHI